jgi:hypothetical protein
MRGVHQWGRIGNAEPKDRFMHPALLFPLLAVFPVGLPIMLVLYLRHQDHGLDLRKVDHALAVVVVPLSAMLILQGDCLVIRCVGDYQIDSFSKAIEWTVGVAVLCGLVGLARLLRVSLFGGDEATKRSRSDRAYATSAATLPSGRVLIFDQRGAVVEEGIFESVKHRVFKDLLAEGRFFFIHLETEPFWEGTNAGHGDGTGGGFVPFFQMRVTAIQTTAAEWLDGGKTGQPVAWATFVWPASGKRDLPPSDVWKLIREIVLAPGGTLHSGVAGTHLSKHVEIRLDDARPGVGPLDK